MTSVKSTLFVQGVFVGRDIQSQRSISRTRLILSARQRMQPVTSNKSTFFSSTNHHPETFPPWIIHSQKIRQENKSNVIRDVSSRSSCYPSAASAKLKSEIDYIQKKYRIQTDLYQKMSSTEKQVESQIDSSYFVFSVSKVFHQENVEVVKQREKNLFHSTIEL